MKELTDFQKKFFARGTGNKLFTQEEFDKAIAIAQAEIMQIAIDTTKTAIVIEREECAKLVDEMRKNTDSPDAPMMLDMTLAQLAQAIRNRMNKNDPT
jgi:hypothetical protein